MKNKSKKIVSGLLAFSLLFGVLATVAYLSKPTETLKNVFTVGKIEDPKIEEPNWPETDPEDPTKPYEPEITPGKIIPKDPIVTIGEESIDSYVYIAVKSKLVYDDNGQKKDAVTYLTGEEAPYVEGFNPNWVKISEEVDEDSVTYIFRYNEKVEKSPTETKLEALFNAVQFNKDLDSDVIGSIPVTDSKQNILVKAFVHQANMEGIEEVAETITYVDNVVKVFFKDASNW